MKATPKLRFVIADDHPMIREALRITISQAFPDSEVLEAGQLSDLTALLAKDEKIDLILLDLTMPGMQGLSGLLYLRAQYPKVPIAVLSANENHEAIRRSKQLGAIGYIKKSLAPDEVLKALKSVVSGKPWIPQDVDLNETDSAGDLAIRLSKLTPQQIRVLIMLGDGLLNKQIAYELSVSEATVKAHVSAILQKLGVDSRTQAVIAASKINIGQWQSDTDPNRTY